MGSNQRLGKIYSTIHLHPGAPLTNFNDGGGGGGGPTEVHILYPKNSTLQNLSTQENHSIF